MRHCLQIRQHNQRKAVRLQNPSKFAQRVRHLVRVKMLEIVGGINSVMALIEYWPHIGH